MKYFWQVMTVALLLALLWVQVLILWRMPVLEGELHRPMAPGERAKLLRRLPLVKIEGDVDVHSNGLFDVNVEPGSNPLDVRVVR